jgi:hypothetical protein
MLESFSVGPVTGDRIGFAEFAACREGRDVQSLAAPRCLR